ncbi:Nicotinamidase-related amidase [Paenibacillus algorifonticola]|uniref:Nicotinamidase-related amidase n=1 Tax=Paenibacillus algorifonticola TaxID=684063 RepID=A0A1I2HQB5_9BACL|nr:isochorismatase family protein [Paenibacillus algorifonticola]SFF31862.1 Nicotinamidase-related amidase [Paenibacillus algorifonticola]
MKQALIIIDVQEAFFNLPENYLYQKEDLVLRINQWIAAARSAEVPVIFIQHTDYDNINDEFYVDSPDWQLYHGLDIRAEDVVSRKTTWDSFHETELAVVLEGKSIDQLIFAGAQTEFCLDTTIRAAYSRGYKSNILAKNSHSTLANAVLTAPQIIEHHEHIWNGRFVTIRELDEHIF